MDRRNHIHLNTNDNSGIHIIPYDQPSDEDPNLLGHHLGIFSNPETNTRITDPSEKTLGSGLDSISYKIK